MYIGAHTFGHLVGKAPGFWGTWCHLCQIPTLYFSSFIYSIFHLSSFIANASKAALFSAYTFHCVPGCWYDIFLIAAKCCVISLLISFWYKSSLRVCLFIFKFILLSFFILLKENSFIELYNSYTIQFTYLKCTIQWFLVYYTLILKKLW